MVNVCPEAGGRGASYRYKRASGSGGRESRRSEQVHQPPRAAVCPAPPPPGRPAFRVQFGRKSATRTHSQQVYSSRPFIFKALEGHHPGPERLQGQRRTQLFARQSRGDASKMNLVLLLGFTQRQAQPKSLCNCLQLTPKHRRPGRFGPADLEVESGTNESSDDCSAVRHTRIPPLPSGTRGDG